MPFEMKIGKEANQHWLASRMRVFIRSRLGLRNVGAFFLLIVSLSLIRRLLAHLHFASPQTIGTMPAVMITAVLSRFFILQLISYTGSRLQRRVLAYEWMRAASHSTTGPALMHAAYNLSRYLLCAS